MFSSNFKFTFQRSRNSIEAFCLNSSIKTYPLFRYFVDNFYIQSSGLNLEISSSVQYFNAITFGSRKSEIKNDNYRINIYRSTLFVLVQIPFTVIKMFK